MRLYGTMESHDQAETLYVYLGFRLKMLLNIGNFSTLGLYPVKK